MTLKELSVEYLASAEAIRQRIEELKAARRHTEDRRERAALERRIYALYPLLNETRRIAGVTAHYYDRRDGHGTI